MPKLSAGIMVYKKVDRSVQVFLVHPGGPFWAKKDAGAWSIPKGEYTAEENPEAAARREFKEETGHDVPEGTLTELGEVKYGNKKVTVWAVEGEVSEVVKSNFMEMEWPPRSGKQQMFPEVDRAGWFNLAAAQKKLVGGQAPFVAMLATKLGIAIGDIPTKEPADEPQLSLF